jgi:hypothetical protein
MDQRPIFQVVSKPGVQRDGTILDSPFYVDGQWVRFYRTRPRKMGGYRAVVEDLRYPARGIAAFSKNNVNSVYVFNSKGARLIQVDNDLTGTLSFDVSAIGLPYDERYLWQSGGIYDATGGGENILIAHPGKNLNDISNSENSPLLYTEAGDSSVRFKGISDGTSVTAGSFVPGTRYVITTVGTTDFTLIGAPSNTVGAVFIATGAGSGTGTAQATIEVSGGVCVLQPYVFAYGNDGYIRNSNQNKPNDWTFGAGKDANEGNFAYTKIVQGLPIRGGGQSPAGLFWSLDTVIKASYVGGAAVFRYDPQGTSTVMSSSGIVELDGYFFWMGLDRFYVYDGKVSELPNQMNINWVLDNLNFEQRQKVWATTVPRWGEVWWFFPFGTEQVECNRAVIFNTREKTWYDCTIERSTGAAPQTIRFPLWGSATPAPTTSSSSSVVTISIATPGVVTWSADHNFQIGQQINLTTTGALPTGLNTTTTYYVATIPSPTTFTLKVDSTSSPINTSGTQSGVHTATASELPRYIVYGQEMGYNSVESGREVAIESYIETSDIGFPTGGATGEQPTGQDYFTRLTRVEPDFIQNGPLTLSVIGNEFAQDGNTVTTSYDIPENTSKVDMREQRRMMRLRVTSNEVNGFFELGRVILHTEPGDIRS